MQQVEFKPLGRRASCLGLGCARIDGRAGLRRARRLIETALDLGINYFDVAASYGAAEEALGAVLSGVDGVVITTKVGPSEPVYNARKMWLKETIRPVLDRAQAIKRRLRTAPPMSARTNRPRYDFSSDRLRRSLDQSRKRLRRDRVEVLLAHEPHRDDLTPELASRFDLLVAEGLVGAFGAGVDERTAPFAAFGSVWQSGWSSDTTLESVPPEQQVFHGVLRYADRDRSGRLVTPPEDLIRTARRLRPDAVILVSASTPERLRQLADGAD
ncbi:MAG: aldo/keto reductase [Planctomycetota bacterium]